ncbi:MAG TPA: hypothetical protein DEP98_01495 [Candidatus Jacksonbacteria bacterium]|nr:hypothetical protein [Candidatus Jacksonbacteria bacterium]
MPRYFKKLLFFTLLIVVATTGILIARAVSNRGSAPVAWWKFDEGQGAIAYDASGTNDATITGATWASEDDCRIGKCLYFDGADDYAQVLDAASLDVGLNDFSISAWVKANQAGDIVTKGTIGNFKLNYTGNNKFWAAVTEDEAGINQPSGVATDGTYLYIADTNNNRIVKRLASNFTYVTEIGSLGTGNDQFSYPYGIATDGTYIYVVDTGNTRIVKRLASDLSYVAQIGSSGSGDDQFSVPNGIATDGTYIYIADTFNNRIVKRLASDLSYVSKIGSFGSGNDQFSSPNGIATDGTYVYVADSSNHRIVKRLATDALTYVSKIGSSGSGNDQFNYPNGVATDGTYIYIADTSNYRIVKRLATDALTYVSKIGSNGSGDDQFNLSASIAVYGAYIYVADTSNNRIVKRMASDALTYVSKIGSSGSGNDQFYSPYGIATDGTYIYVADTSNNRIVKRLASDLSYVSQIGTLGTGNDQFSSPSGIATDGTNVYVADTGNNRIVKRLASNLSYVSKIGTQGSGNDQFNNPSGIAVLGAYIYVADSYNYRIVKRLSANALTYVSKIGSNGSGDDQFNQPAGIATDGTYIYVADQINQRIVKRLAADALTYVSQIGSYGTGNDQFLFPYSITTDGTYIYVADTRNNRLVKRLASDLSYVSQIGTLGTSNDQFSYPRGIAFWDGSYIYVADTNNHRIVKRLATDLSYVDEIGKNVSSSYSTRSLAKNTWYYVVLTGSHAAPSLTLSIYINGVLDSSVETADRYMDNSSNLKIGGNTSYFKGLIDDVRVFNYARSTAQIKADYVAKSSERGAISRSVSVGESRDAGEGLVAYWKMDESSWASGTAAIIDSSGNANTGTAYAGVNTTGTAKFGLAGSFDGTNDYGEITSVAGSTLDITGNATVSAWVYPTMLSSDANSKRIVEKAADGLSFTYIASTARIGFGDTNGYMYATKDIRSGWHHVAAVKSGTTTTGIKIYVDGVDQGTLTQSGTWNGWTTSANPFRIGARNTILASTYWQGIIDDVKIYNTARDANQIRRDYESGPPPVAHWKMDEKTGDTAYDTAGTNNGDLAGACPGAATCPIWTQGKYGSALKFDGVNDYVSVANSLSNVRTVDFWVNNGNANDGLLELINNDTYISIASSAISATNFSSASTYVDGVAGVTAISSGWHHVAVTTATGITASSIVIGEANSDFSAGSIDDVRVYNYARTPKQILEDMSARGGSAFGGNAGGAVGYWDFNEAQGLTAYDRSSNDNDLTLSTASWTTAGKYGAAFAGVTNRRLTKTDDPDFDFAAADDFSISTWFKRDTVSNAEYLIYKQNGFEGYTIYMDASGDIIFGIGDVNSASFPEESIGNIARDYDNNAWHHAVGVKTSNSRIDLYVDGVLIASDTSLTTDASLENAGKLIIADSDEADGTDEFLGTIDEVKIYRVALSPADIKLEYNHGASLRLGSIGTESDGTTPSNSAGSAYCVPGDTTACSAPVLNIKMDEKSGQYANDMSGSGNNGTLGSGATPDSADPAWQDRGKCASGACLKFDGVDDYFSIPDFSLE